MLHREPVFFCSSLVKSGPAWLHPEELKFEAEKYFCCININRTTTQSLQMEIAFSLVFRPTFASLHRVPFKDLFLPSTSFCMQLVVIGDKE